MRIEEKQIISYKTVYISKDGKEFDNERSCELHEFRETANKVYAVFKRGSRIDNIELFSTKEKAQQSIDNILVNKDLYSIIELYVDEGLLRIENS